MTAERASEIVRHWAPRFYFKDEFFDSILNVGYIDLTEMELEDFIVKALIKDLLRQSRNIIDSLEKLYQVKDTPSN